MPQSMITVRFIENRPLLSRAIAWYTNSLWSHVEFGTPENTWIGAHLIGGVKERPYDYCNPLRDERYGLPLANPARLAAFLKLLRRQVGTPYGVTDIAGLALHRRKLHGLHGVICSQFVTQNLVSEFGAARVLNVLPNYYYLVTPEMLHLSPIFVGRRL